MPKSVLIFLLPPSLEELEERIRIRNLDSEEMIKNRLKIALIEIDISNKYDYVITNNKIESTLNKLSMIINEEKK